MSFSVSSAPEYPRLRTYSKGCCIHETLSAIGSKYLALKEETADSFFFRSLAVRFGTACLVRSIANQVEMNSIIDVFADERAKTTFFFKLS